MLVDYAVTDMVCFDDYSDAAPRAKTMRRNGINLFLLHVAQCIIFDQTKLVTETLILETWLKSLYSKLGFKVIKYFERSPNFGVGSQAISLRITSHIDRKSVV